MTWTDIGYPIGFVVIGGVAGWLYFVIMRRSVMALHAPGQPRMSWFFLLMLVRMALFAGGLTAAFTVGLWSVLTYSIGFFGVRTVIVARARKETAEAATGQKDEDHG